MNQTPYPKNFETALKWDYKFWDTQPVAKLKETVAVEGEFPDVGINDKPDSLPEGFNWVNYDFTKLEDKQKVSAFLNKFYGMDISGEFIKQYNETFIDWISKDKTYVALGVEHKSSLMGFIFGYVQKTQVNRRKLDVIEVGLACIHPKLRSKRLTPRLIEELRRQFNLLGYKYATFSTVNYLSKPFSSSVAWNRIISAKILIETGFVKLDDSISFKEVKKASQLPEEPTENFKKMEESHVDQAFDLFNRYIDKYNVHPIFTKDEFKREFYNNKFINAFVIEDNKGNVVDFVSYYALTTNVLAKNEKYKNIKRGYLYYYTCQNSTPYKLLQNVLIFAKKYGVDVFTALDNMENMYVLRELGFDETPTTYRHYIYNLKIPQLQNFQVAKLYL